MPIDPDQIRIDVLKAKRKIYLSFPDGSQAQKDFLRASKLSEISYLSKLIPTELVTSVFNEHQSIIRTELITIWVMCGCGISLSLILFALHQIFPKTVWLYLLFIVPFLVSLIESFRHVLLIRDQYKKVEPFRNEYDSLQSQIKKLTNELGEMK